VCLDVGSGLGAHTFNLAPYVKMVHSFDLSKKRVRFCEYRKKFESVQNVRIFHSDTTHLPFEAETFDNIIMNGIVEWLPEAEPESNPRASQVGVIKKMWKLLKPGGRIYIGIENRVALNYLTSARDHNRLKYTTLMPRFLASFITWLFRGKPYRTYTYSIFGYRKLLKDAGFDISKITFYIAHPGYNLPKYIIPFEDIGALRFFLGSIAKEKGWKGEIIQLLAKSDLCLRLLRHGFYSYAIYAEK
jgi:SAM-dependent methyltransferase